MPDASKPPAHLSDSDPWKAYRQSLRRAEASRLGPPRHFSKQG